MELERDEPTVAALLERHGPAAHPERPPAHPRPDHLDDDTLDALTQLSAALEVVEDARGHLYSFHRLCGRADLDLQQALDRLREAGHRDLADDLARLLVGRDVIAGRWSFQLVEDYDAGYVEVFRQAERAARRSLGVPDPHVGEAQMKHGEQQVPAQQGANNG